MVNFSPLAAEICWGVWGTPANFNGFRVLAALLHGTLVVGVSQTLRSWTEGATYIRQGDHHVGYWPTFLFINDRQKHVNKTRMKDIVDGGSIAKHLTSKRVCVCVRHLSELISERRLVLEGLGFVVTDGRLPINRSWDAVCKWFSRFGVVNSNAQHAWSVNKQHPHSLFAYSATWVTRPMVYTAIFNFSRALT